MTDAGLLGPAAVLTLAGGRGPLTPSSVGTAWDLDPVVLAAAAALLVGYLVAARRLRAGGHDWPAGRSIAWVVAVAALLATTTGVLAAYDELLFWPDITEHVALSLLVPPLLAFGLPVTLGLKTLPAGGRRRAQSVLRSRPMAVLANPVAAFAVMMAVLVLPYPSGGYAVALEHPALHHGWHLALLVTGCLLFWPLFGRDPVPGRVPHLFRQAVLLASLPVYVVVGLALLNGEDVLAADHFAALDRGWGPTVAADQRAGGAVFAWAGNALSILYGFVLLIVWMRDDGTRARQVDRAHDLLVAQGRDADTELAQYNAWLASLRRGNDR